MIPSGTRFIGFSDSVNLTERRSASVNAETAPYTVEDIKGYQVYTALLTQGGTPTSSVVSYDEALSVGVTYTIADNDGGTADFTNVGAPNNNEETYFVATGEVPNSWGANNLASLTYNKANIIVTVLENTIGNIWCKYNGVGQYAIISNDLFTENKTTVITSPAGYIESPTDIYNLNASWAMDSVDLISISSYYNNESADGAINYSGAAMIEIRVYN